MKQKTLLWAAGGCAVGSALMFLLCAVPFAIWFSVSGQPPEPKEPDANNKPPPTPLIVGKWVGAKGDRLSFGNHGFFFAGGVGLPKEGIKGTYRILDANLLEIVSDNNTKKLKYKVTDNRLELDPSTDLIQLPPDVYERALK
jgi:hypothetical protein